MEATSLNENTYALLKNDIMTLKLVPGEAVSAAKIADRYKVSRTPAREAIVKLDKEGLLKIIPQSKTMISKIDLNRAAQEWFVRSSLELAMVPAFIRNCTEETIQNMEDNLQEQRRTHIPVDAIEHFRLDNAFHGIIYETAGENLAKEIIDSQMTHYNRIRFLTDLNMEIREKTLKEHEDMIQAAREKDAEWLQALIKRHIRRIYKEQNEIVEKYPEYFLEREV